jgi:hypothetical protein
VFCSGVLLGFRDGMLVGAITMVIYSVLNPYGPVHPAVTASQVSGEVIAGATGALAARAHLPEAAAGLRAVVLALAAAGITAVYDFLTNVASGIVYGQIKATLIGGIPFALWHIATNVGLFVILGTPLVAIFARYRTRLA